MKYYWIALSVLMILIFTSCNKEIELGNPVNTGYYYKLAGTFFDDYYTSVEPCWENDIAITSYYTDDNGSNHATVYILNSTGMQRWRVNDKETHGTKAHDVYFNNTANQLVVAYGLDNSQGLSKVKVLNYNNAGEVIGDTATINIEATKIADIGIFPQTTGEHLYVVQFKGADGQNYQRAYKLAANGTIDKDFEMPLDPLSHDTLQIATLSDTRAFVTTTTESKIMLTALSNEKSEWSRIYPTEGKLESANIQLIKGIVLITATLTDGDKSGIYVLETNYEGDILSEKRFTLPEGIKVNDFFVNEAGNYAITGTKEIIEREGTYALFLEISPEGIVINENVYGYEGENSGQHISRIVGTSKYLIVGQMWSANNFDIFATKVNAQGYWNYSD